MRAGPDDSVTFEITYHNEANVRVRGVVITVDLPESLLDLAWTATNPTLSERPGSRVYLGPGRAPRRHRACHDHCADSGGHPAGGPALAAIRQHHESRSAKLNRQNNQAGPLTVALLPVNLRIAQSVEPSGAAIKPGERITFTLGYANLGPADAHAVAVELPLPVALDAVEISQAGSTATFQPGSHYGWRVASLPLGGKGRLVISGRVPHAC